MTHSLTHYMARMASECRLCALNRFKAVTCSGPEHLEGLFAELSNHGKLCMYGRYLAMYNL